MEEVRVLYMDLPHKARAMVVKMFDDGEDYYTIVINSRLSIEEQRKACEHEMRHIRRNDFQMDTVQDIEAECHA